MNLDQSELNALEKLIKRANTGQPEEEKITIVYLDPSTPVDLSKGEHYLLVASGRQDVMSGIELRSISDPNKRYYLQSVMQIGPWYLPVDAALPENPRNQLAQAIECGEVVVITSDHAAEHKWKCPATFATPGDPIRMRIYRRIEVAIQRKDVAQIRMMRNWNVQLAEPWKNTTWRKDVDKWLAWFDKPDSDNE